MMLSDFAARAPLPAAGRRLPHQRLQALRHGYSDSRAAAEKLPMSLPRYDYAELLTGLTLLL
jgi:hypothetical protein